MELNFNERKLALSVTWTTFKCMTSFFNLQHVNKFSKTTSISTCNRTVIMTSLTQTLYKSLCAVLNFTLTSANLCNSKVQTRLNSIISVSVFSQTISLQQNLIDS